jgi:NTP pyrophosphatase (non-canonical NTP hydrolase)
MKIKEIENRFKIKLESYENKWDFDARILHLVEEVGELAEIILQYKEIKKPKKNISDIKVALADVIDDVYAIALINGISLDELTLEVLKNDEK